MPDDRFKEYNEAVKMSEHLAKRESELVQKLAQAADSARLEDKEEWVEELRRVIKAAKTMKRTRNELLTSITPPDGSPLNQ